MEGVNKKDNFIEKEKSLKDALSQKFNINPENIVFRTEEISPEEEFSCSCGAVDVNYDQTAINVYGVIDANKDKDKKISREYKKYLPYEELIGNGDFKIRNINIVKKRK